MPNIGGQPVIDLQGLTNQVAGMGGQPGPGTPDPVAAAYEQQTGGLGAQGQPPPMQLDPQAVARAYHSAMAQMMSRKTRARRRRR